MDSINRRIISLLQENGKLSLTELADEVGLSVSPTHRRVRDLETSGAITGYRATIDPAHINLGFETLVFVIIKQPDQATLNSFEEAVTAVPQVLQAQRLFGNPDYLLRVCTPTMADYTQLQDDVLAALPGVMRMDSTPIMKSVVRDRPYPTNFA